MKFLKSTFSAALVIGLLMSSISFASVSKNSDEFNGRPITDRPHGCGVNCRK